MLRISAWHSVFAAPRAQRHPPSVRGRLRRGLALWLKGTLLVHNGCQDSVAAALETHGCFEPMHRELRDRPAEGDAFPLAWLEKAVDPAAPATEEWRQPVQHCLARWNQMWIH